MYVLIISLCVYIDSHSLRTLCTGDLSYIVHPLWITMWPLELEGMHGTVSTFTVQFVTYCSTYS